MASQVLETGRIARTATASEAATAGCCRLLPAADGLAAPPMCDGGPSAATRLRAPSGSAMEAVGRGPGKVSGEARAVPTPPNFTLLTTALIAAITLAGCTAAETDALKPAAVSELPDPELPDEVGVVPAARPVAGAAGAAEAAQEAIGAVATAYAASRPAGAAAILAQAGSSAAIPAPDGRLGPQAVGARSAELDQLIARYAAHYGVPESLVRRVVKRESTFNPAARNGPYWGLMQILPATAR